MNDKQKIEQLRSQGWNQMNTMLDQQKVVKKNTNYGRFFLTTIALFGLVGGYCLYENFTSNKDLAVIKNENHYLSNQLNNTVSENTTIFDTKNESDLSAKTTNMASRDKKIDVKNDINTLSTSINRVTPNKKNTEQLIDISNEQKTLATQNVRTLPLNSHSILWSKLEPKPYFVKVQKPAPLMALPIVNRYVKSTNSLDTSIFVLMNTSSKNKFRDADWNAQIFVRGMLGDDSHGYGIGGIIGRIFNNHQVYLSGEIFTDRHYLSDTEAVFTTNDLQIESTFFDEDLENNANDYQVDRISMGKLSIGYKYNFNRSFSILGEFGFYGISDDIIVNGQSVDPSNYLIDTYLLGVGYRFSNKFELHLLAEKNFFNNVTPPLKVNQTKLGLRINYKLY